jgi:hypothetical protein
MEIGILIEHRYASHTGGPTSPASPAGVGAYHHRATNTAGGEGRTGRVG